MIILERLKWSNCFSYGPGNEIRLDENTVTQIVGTNGMGKSSIPLIIEEVLFNKNSKGIKKVDIPNRYINDGYSINLTFRKDDDRYEIDVQRKASSKVKLLKNGEDISSHTATNTYKTIGELIGSDFKTFSQLVYQNTNNSLQFLTATDTNRKKFLIDLLHLENYVMLFELFKEAAKEVSTETARISGAIDNVESWLEKNKLSDTTTLPIVNLEIETDKDEKLQDKLTEEIKNINEKNKKIQSNNSNRQALEAIDLTELDKITVTELKSYDKEQSEIGMAKAAMANSKRLLDKLESLGDHCPTCEQDIDSSFKQSLINSEKDELDAAKQRCQELTDIVKRIKEENEQFRHKIQTQKSWEELYRLVDFSLPTTALDMAVLEEELAAVQLRISSARSRLEEAQRENERRRRHNSRIQVIQEQTEEQEKSLKENQALLADQQNLLSDLEVLKKTFSTNGLIAYKIENLVEELEELVNMYLAELSDGKFTLEFVVSNDKLNVQITDNELIVDILALSSGELARVNTATLLAIRKLMSSISKSKINILFLDEVTNVLDLTGREKLVEVLLEEENLNTFIVSHGWTHPLVEKLEVNKKENVSYVE